LINADIEFLHVSGFRNAPALSYITRIGCVKSFARLKRRERCG
jgi:hypothetical protein